MSPTVLVGGQAVIEGVMMRCEERVATAVRRADGRIVIKEDSFTSLTKRLRFLRLPILRGVVFLLEMMVLGIKTLTWSANQVGEEGEEQLTWWQILLTLLFSFGLTILIFVIAPYYTAQVFTEHKDLLFNLIDGVLRLVFFVGYILAISLMGDVRRVFQYHGAEHKAVNCYEAGEELTVKNVMKYTTRNIRCGTSLIVFVIAISIVLFSLLQSELWYVNIGMRIVLIPLIAGIGYELLKLSFKMQDNVLLRALSAPGLWVQGLTTREPDERQVECAIEAMRKVLP